MTKEKIYVGVDNERIEATGEILAQILSDKEFYIQEKLQKEAETEAKAAAKTAAQAKLAALGLTIEDLQALGL